MAERAERGVGFRHAAIFCAVLMLAGCGGPFSTLEPEGPSARGAATLWWIMLAGSAVIFLAVSALLVLALIRPGPLRTTGSGRLILWGGLVVPSLVLAALVVSALALGERLIPAPRDPAPLRIEAIARQWAWEFRHPDQGGFATTDRLRLPAGRDVDFVVVSEDVIHSFWIPRLGGKIDAIPGRQNVVRLRADRPGVFGGVCAEFCGLGHGRMMFTVEALADDDYESWVTGTSGGEAAQ